MVDSLVGCVHLAQCLAPSFLRVQTFCIPTLLLQIEVYWSFKGHHVGSDG